MLVGNLRAKFHARFIITHKFREVVFNLTVPVKIRSQVSSVNENQLLFTLHSERQLTDKHIM